MLSKIITLAVTHLPPVGFHRPENLLLSRLRSKRRYVALIYREWQLLAFNVCASAHLTTIMAELIY